MRVGIIVERRVFDSPWPSETWRPAAVLAGGGPEDWRRLHEGGGLARYHAGCLTLELHHRQSVEYRYNLLSRRPTVFVALRRTAEGVRPWCATVSAHEAEATLDSGDDIVGAVPMPPAIAAWMARFVEAYPVIEPFRKRRSRRAKAGDGEAVSGRRR